MTILARQSGQAVLEGQLTLPNIALCLMQNDLFRPRKKAMEYEYSDSPTEPTGRQNKFVLKQLRANPSGITTAEFTARGVTGSRPRVRDLRDLGHHIETAQDNPHDVGRYILMTALSTRGVRG